MSDAIEKRGQSALVVPEFLKGVNTTEGLENVSREDLVLPRLSVCQAMSPQRKKTMPQYIEGLADGEMFNTVTKDIYGERVEVIPILYSKSRIYFRDLAAGGGILCQSRNGIDGGTIAPTCEACPNSRFAENGDTPKCNVFMNVVSMILPQRQLIILSFKSTELKAARAWVTLMKSRNKPAYTQVYSVGVASQKNQKGEFFVRTLDFKRWVTEEEFELVHEEYNNIKSKVIVTDEPDDHAEESDEPVPF